MGYSADEIAILDKNPYIRFVSPLTFVMDESLYESLFLAWTENKSVVTIREGLCRSGIPEGRSDCAFVPEQGPE